MYSRNSQTFRDDFDEVSEEEYELYKYNLPPKYDGSRFRTRRNQRRRFDAREERDRVRKTHDYPEVLPEEIPEKEEKIETYAEDVTAVVEEPQKKHDPGSIEKLLGHIGDKFGSEELLIISLIIFLAGESGAEDSGDIILLLALLLIAG